MPPKCPTWEFPQAQPELWGQWVPVTCRVALPWNCRAAEGLLRYSAHASVLLSSCREKSERLLCDSSSASRPEDSDYQVLSGPLMPGPKMAEPGKCGKGNNRLLMRCLPHLPLLKAAPVSTAEAVIFGSPD